MCVLCVVYVINTQKRAAPKLCSRMPQQPGRAGGRAASGQAGPEPEPGRGPGTRPGPGQLHTCHTPGLAAALAWNGRARPSGRRLPGISPARLATAGPLACAMPLGAELLVGGLAFTFTGCVRVSFFSFPGAPPNSALALEFKRGPTRKCSLRACSLLLERLVVFPRSSELNSHPKFPLFLLYSQPALLLFANTQHVRSENFRGQTVVSRRRGRS